MMKLNWRNWVLSLQFHYQFTESWQGKHKRDYAEWYARLPIGATIALRHVEAENPYSDYREPIEQSTIGVEPWAIEHNASLEQSAIEKSRRWRADRLARIKHLQACRKLERMIAKHHRRTASPQQSPVETVFSYPRPAVNLLGEDTTELALKTLLSDIADDDRRADVAAQCWIVRAQHPSLPPLSVFRRSLEICKQASRGVYSEKDRHQRRENGIPTNEFGAPMHSKAVSYWESSCEQLNKVEREQLAVVIARSSLGREILDKYLQGKTYEQIAQEMGVSARTIYRRFAALEQKSSVEWSTERNSVFVRVD